MEENFNKILGQFGAAIEAQIESANARAAASEARVAYIVEGLSKLVNACSSNDNDAPNSEATLAGVAHYAPKASSNAPNPKIKAQEDALFAALGSNWIGAAALRKRLGNLGMPVSEGTLYNRMRKLAKARPEEIETATKPERWRLRTPLGDSQPETKVKKPRQSRRNKAPQNEIPSAPLQISNDNDSKVLRPTLIKGDCLEEMRRLPDDSVDLILADLPYGTTGLDIDKLLPLDKVWAEYRRILRKPHGNIVLFGSQPFTTSLINSASDLFLYSMVWDKGSATDFLRSHDKPLNYHEDVMVFSFGVNTTAERSQRRATYNPNGAIRVPRIAKGPTKISYLAKAAQGHTKGTRYQGLTNCPTSILRFPKDPKPKNGVAHPFAKPVALLEHLVRCYSNPGDTVLDNTMGSGSTCVAAAKCGRQAIGIEKEPKWFAAAQARVAELFSDVSPSITSPVSGAPQPPADYEIHNGDCLEIMRTLPSGSVDLVFTSPPYNICTAQGAFLRDGKAVAGYDGFCDALPHAEYVEWMREVLRESWRLVSAKGAIFFNHKPRIKKGEQWLPLELNPDLPLRQIIIWDRGSGFNHNATYFTPSHEWVMLFAKPDFRLKLGNEPRQKDVWSITPEKKSAHPAPFPVKLPQTAIEWTDAKVVLDPFMGSGTTGVAALRAGRKFIGIEQSERYVRDALARLENDRLPLAA